jgi:hypothetical protein
VERTDPSQEVGSEPRRRVRPATVLAVLFFVLLAGFWGWVWYYHLSGQGEIDMPDRLDDLSWTVEADQICEAAEARIAALPGAHNAASADDRADVIEIATGEIETMLVELEAIVPTGASRDARITSAWLDDYRTFVDDRYRYAETLRVDPGARFLVTEKQGRYITAPIDRFARVNEMEGCMAPEDV